MVRGAAADNPDGRYLPHVLVREARAGNIQDALLQHSVQRVLDGPGLLVNLLHHEVLEAALLRRLGVPGDLRHFLFHNVAVQVDDLRLFRGDPRHLQVPDVDDPAGVL